MPMLLKYIPEKTKPASHYEIELPEGLDELILSCLAKYPAQRPTAKQLRERLASIPMVETWDNDLATRWWAEHTLHRESSDEEERPDPDTSFNDITSTNPRDYPTEEDLRRWIGGAMSLKRTTVVELHLEMCEDCAERVGLLSKQDEFVDHLRNAMSPADDSGFIVNDKNDWVTRKTQMRSLT